MRDMEGSQNPPPDRILLERYENENSTEYVHLGHPGYPNEAGIAWINLMKKEFASNFEIESIPGITSSYLKNIFFGKYLIKVVDSNGQTIYEAVEKVEPDSSCNFYSAENNLITDGDFDEDELGDIWIIPNGIPRINWDGYIKDGLKVTDRSGDGYRALAIDLEKSVPESGQYVIQK